MNERYMKDLHILKKTFDSKNESNIILNSIINHHTSKSLNILDVGLGKGTATFQVLKQLNKLGYKINLTGIDRYIDKNIKNKYNHKIVLLEKDFRNYTPCNKYDIIIATQSLYYLGSIRLALKKFLRLLDKHGCLLITSWSKDCTLFDLHKKYARNEISNTLTAETIANLLNEIVNYGKINIVKNRGTVNISDWLKHDEICNSAFRILSRTEESTIHSLKSYYNFKNHLESLPPLVERINGTVVFKSGMKKAAI